MMTSFQPATLLSPAAFREHDRPVVRIIALARVVIATGAAVTVSFAPGLERRDTLLWWIGLAWLPWAGIVAMTLARPNSLFTRLGGAVGDLVMVSVVGYLYPGRMGVALGYGLVVAAAAYTSSRLIGLGVAFLSFGSIILVQSALDEPDRMPLTALALVGLTLLLLVALVDRASAIHRTAEADTVRAQAKAAAVLAHVASSVVVTDCDGTIIEANPAAERLLAESTANVRGRHCADVLALHDGERRLDCSTGCALLAMRSDDGVELWRPRGSTRQPLLANAEGVRDSEGNVVDIVHSLRDVSTLKQADEAKTLFLATASHELKTPLTVIRGFAETLRRVPDLPAASRDAALEAIHRRAIELGESVERLLLSSRIEAGRLDLLTTAVELDALLGERLEAIRGATGRDIITILDEHLPSVRGDAVAIATVLDHLVENAIKYSTDDTTVTVTARVDGDDVVVTVADSGIGMDEDQVARCFEKFWQAESSDRRRYGGTGIGLYIVKSMVEAMAGTIAVASAAGRGTTFSVRFKIYVDVATPQPGEAGGGAQPEPSIVREFMRQLGIPTAGGGGV